MLLIVQLFKCKNDYKEWILNGDTVFSTKSHWNRWPSHWIRLSWKRLISPYRRAFSGDFQSWELNVHVHIMFLHLNNWTISNIPYIFKIIKLKWYVFWGLVVDIRDLNGGLRRFFTLKANILPKRVTKEGTNRATNMGTNSITFMLTKVVTNMVPIKVALVVAILQVIVLILYIYESKQAYQWTSWSKT